MPNRLGYPDRFEGEQYRQLLEAAPDAIVVVGELATIELVNLQTENLFGYPRSELLGHPLEMLIPERFRAAHLSDIRRFFESPTVRAMGSGIELFGQRKDGTELPIEVSLSPLLSKGRISVSAAIRDISQRKSIQILAKVNAERLVSAVESIHDAFALFDANGALVLCNNVYRRLLNETQSGALVGKSFQQMLDAGMDGFVFANDHDRSQFRAIRTIEQGNASGETYDVVTRDGRSLRIANHRTAEGGIVQTIWDLTNDVRMAEELREAQRAAEAGSAAKSEFLSSMSHELRTPLNAILGFAQLLQRDKKSPLSDRHLSRVDQILKGGEHLLRLIDDILDLSRIEAGDIAISTEPVDPLETLSALIVTLEPAATRAAVRIELTPLPSDLPMIAADRTRFAQILMNFGSNAIKYNRPGGYVSFTVTKPDHRRVRVTVRDTGIGVPIDKQRTLFQPFQRAGQETGPIQGTGIGLSISKRLAELMGGSVGFDSAADGGSEFWVDTPVHQSGALSTPPPVSPTRAPSPTWQTASNDGPNEGLLLYVEDNPANVMFMTDLLGNFKGVELMTASTAEVGIELARAHLPQIIILDINFPGMSGLDALRILRESPETREIPVIALTAAASERDKQRGQQAGFYRYLTKPVKVEELEAALTELLTPPPSSRERAQS